MSTKKKIGRLAVAAILALLLLSCPNPLGAPENPEAGGGTLIINILTATSKSIVPPIDMNPSSFTISGIGPDGSSFTETTVADSVLIPDLRFGEWTIIVDALNAAADIVGRGQQTVVVSTGEVITVGIIVRPLSGYGTLDLSVQWNEADLENPSVEAQLIPAAGSAIDLAFTFPSPGTAACSNPNIPTGYYTLVLKLSDSGILVAGAVETVRIVKDQTTTAVFAFDEVNQPGGQISINITPELDDPIEVTMTGQADTLLFGETMSVSASVPADTGNVVYAWYLNGQASGIDPVFTTDSTLPIGVYRLDLTAISADGSRAGSATHTFRVLAGTLAQVTLIWDANSESDLSGYKLYYGFTSRSYEFVVDVGNRTTYTLTDLDADKTYYIAATAYNTSGGESGYSNEVIFKGVG